jgi:hypothetical protein
VLVAALPPVNFAGGGGRLLIDDVVKEETKKETQTLLSFSLNFYFFSHLFVIFFCFIAFLPELLRAAPAQCSVHSDRAATASLVARNNAKLRSRIINQFIQFL